MFMAELRGYVRVLKFVRVHFLPGELFDYAIGHGRRIVISWCFGWISFNTDLMIKVVNYVRSSNTSHCIETNVAMPYLIPSQLHFRLQKAGLKPNVSVQISFKNQYVFKGSIVYSGVETKPKMSFIVR